MSPAGQRRLASIAAPSNRDRPRSRTPPYRLRHEARSASWSNFVEKPRRCCNDEPLGSFDVHHHQWRWRMLIEEYIERHRRHYPIAALADSTERVRSSQTWTARSLETAASITSTVRLLSARLWRRRSTLVGSGSTAR